MTRAEAAEKLIVARQRLSMAVAVNVYNRSVEELAAIQIAYDDAEREFRAAENDYRNAP